MNSVIIKEHLKTWQKQSFGTPSYQIGWNNNFCCFHCAQPLYWPKQKNNLYLKPILTLYGWHCILLHQTKIELSWLLCNLDLQLWKTIVKVIFLSISWKSITFSCLATRLKTSCKQMQYEKVSKCMTFEEIEKLFSAELSQVKIMIVLISSN